MNEDEDIDENKYDKIDRLIFEWLDDLEKNQDKGRVYMPGLSGEFEWEHLKDFYLFVIKKMKLTKHLGLIKKENKKEK